MAGYNYYEGMSNNALDAYEDGKKPLSRITALDLKLAGWQGTKADAMRLAKSKFWKPCEWHHSGGTWYNEVYFYAMVERKRPAVIISVGRWCDENTDSGLHCRSRCRRLGFRIWD